MELTYDERAGNGGGSNSKASATKIIKTARISLETREFDAHVRHVRQQAEDMGGYISDSYVDGKAPEYYDDNGRYASITVRVPQERMESFLSDTRGLATVINESIGGDDITFAYSDTEKRLEIYTSQRERILALLETAENVEDIIELETELSRLTYEIEDLTSSLRGWDDLVDYATVTVEINELPPSTPATGPDDMGTRIREGWQGSLNGITVFFQGLAVFLIGASPVLLILAVLAVIIIAFARRYSRKRRARREQSGAAFTAGGPYADTGRAGAKRQKNTPAYGAPAAEEKRDGDPNETGNE
jgi:hypothetical protein